MIDSTVLINGIAASQSLAGNVTVNPTTKFSRTFDVTNGLVQGDFIRPNPVRFTIYDVWTRVANRTLYKGPTGLQTQKWWGENPYVTPLVASAPTGVPGTLLTQPVLHGRAMAKIYDKIRGNSETVVDLLEGAKTLRMLRSATNLVKGVGTVLDWIARDVRRGAIREERLLDFVTGKWLEYRYGWRPLVNSVYDAFDNLVRVESSALRTIVARSGHKDTDTTVLQLSQNSYGTYPVLQEILTNERIRLVYNFDLRDRNQLWDWTSLNPATIAWELLPFSFIADWFFSIGDSLRELENWWLLRSKFHSGYYTYSYDVRRERKLKHVKLASENATMASAGFIAEAFDAHMGWTWKLKDRVLVTSLPTPRGPRFRLKIGAEKCLDAAALLQGLVGKRSRQWNFPL